MFVVVKLALVVIIGSVIYGALLQRLMISLPWWLRVSVFLVVCFLVLPWIF